MKLDEKLQLLRKKNGFSQEQLADQLGVARQPIGKWENGQAVPETGALILLSDLYRITIDRLVKDDDECNIALRQPGDMDVDKVIEFLLQGKKNTYAGHGTEVESCRLGSHDYLYEDGDYTYYDTYYGGEFFTGEESVSYQNTPIWAMNYSGRVLSENFSGDFLKEALFHVPKETPYRGPAMYQSGEYCYHCKVDGAFIWYQGYEEIFYENEKIYECYFHGGVVK